MPGVGAPTLEVVMSAFPMGFEGEAQIWRENQARILALDRSQEDVAMDHREFLKNHPRDVIKTSSVRLFKVGEQRMLILVYVMHTPYERANNVDKDLHFFKFLIA